MTQEQGAHIAEADESGAGQATVAALTEAQRQLVRENLGLVGVHLRRHAGQLVVPRRHREWEDLFQEGCLGLMRAAVDFDAARGIPFAAFALPRIHNAVSRALAQRFQTVRVPAQRRRSATDDHAVARDEEVRRPRDVSMSDAVQRRITERPLSHCRQHDPSGPPAETIGGRLREKFERAVRQAGDAAGRCSTGRGDREKLVEKLVAERLLIPAEEARGALRQIARETKSSFARVAQCERLLADGTRKLLEADPEFRVLRDAARRDPDGVGGAIDPTLERELATISADAFLSRYEAAEGDERARLLHALLEVSRRDIREMVRGGFHELDPAQRERLHRPMPAAGKQTATRG